MIQKLVQNGMKRQNFLSKTVMKSPLLPITYDLSNAKKKILRKKLNPNIFNYKVIALNG